MNGSSVLYIFLVIFVVGRTTHSELSGPIDTEYDEQAAKGNLYDLLIKRLGKIYDEITWYGDKPLESAEEPVPLIEMPLIPDRPARIENGESVAPGHLYDSFKQRLDDFRQYALEPIESLKHKIDNCEKLSPSEGGLYDELMKNIENLSDVSLDPKKDLENLSDAAEKRSTINDNLSEEYKKRLDKIGNENSPDGEKVFDRSGRQVSAKRIIRNRPKAVRTSMSNKNSLNIRSRSFVDSEAGKTLLKEYLKHIPKNRQNQRQDTLEGMRCGRKLVHVVNGKYLRKHNFEKNSARGDDVNKADSIDDFRDSHAAKHGKNKQMLPTHKTKAGHRRITRLSNDDTYPEVLTKALEASLDPLHPPTKNLLGTVAEKMNMSTLDLAKKLTSGPAASNPVALENDAKLNEIVQKFLQSSVVLQANNTSAASIGNKRPPKHSKEAAAEEYSSTEELAEEDCESDYCEEGAEANVTNILERVLSKLEEIQTDKVENPGGLHPEGAPCNLVGSWNSNELGLQLIISVGGKKDRTLSKAEKNNKLLTIKVHECNPPKPHKTPINTESAFMGSSIKLLGGPFFIYSQKREDNIIAIFSGFCRTCGGIDTIFGSWTFLLPSKDCQDISAAIENKRDILRRYSMEAKRKQRIKDMLSKKQLKSKRHKRYMVDQHLVKVT